MEEVFRKYKTLLSDYLITFEEAKLLHAHDFAKNVASGHSIPQIVNVHFDALRSLDLTSEKLKAAQRFLHEIIMGISIETGLHTEEVMTALYEEAVINFFEHFEENWKKEQSLHKWSQKLNRAASLEEIFEYTFDAIEKILQYKYVLVLLEENNALKVKAHRGFKEFPKTAQEFPLNEQNPIVSAFTEEETTLAKTFNRPRKFIGDYPKIKSEIAVPIKSGKEVLGIIDVQSIEEDAFQQSDKRLIEMVASHVAVAIKEILERMELVSLRRLEELRNRFLIMAAHEIKTPLTPIKACLEMLKKGYSGDLIKQQEREVAKVLEHVDRLDRLVDDFQRISKFQTGSLDIEKSKHQLTATIEKAIQKFKEVLGDERIMVLTKKHQKPLTAFYDEDRIIQLIRNILENAIDYTQGNIIIEIGQDEENVWFSISDNGPGIPEAIQDKIFKPFYRVEEDRSRKGRHFGGAGLGLYICKQIVEAHRGTIQVDSQLEEGSTFTITLPKTPIEA